jgi:hypothetical protein
MFDQILSALKSGNTWAIAAAITLYVRHVLSDRSKFPWTIPARWLSTVTAFGTLLASGELLRAGGLPWPAVGAASFGAAAVSGFFDGVIVAIWGKAENAPAWARFVVMLADDAGEAEAKQNPPPAPPPDATSPPPAAIVAAAASLAIMLVGCSSLAKSSTLPADLDREYACVTAQIVAGNTDVPSIAKACMGEETMATIDIIEALLSSPEFKAMHQGAVEPLRMSVALNRPTGVCR